ARDREKTSSCGQRKRQIEWASHSHRQSPCTACRRHFGRCGRLVDQRHPVFSAVSHLGAAQKEVLQHNCVVMCFIMGGEYERDPAVLRKLAQPIELLWVVLDLRLIATPEFLPAARIMAEPFAHTLAVPDPLHPPIS